MLRTIPWFVSSLMNHNLIHRRLHVIEIQLIFCRNHVVVGKECCLRREVLRCNSQNTTCQRYTSVRTYINERLNGINAPQVIRNFGKDHAICQKHLLERSIADTGETQPHPFPSAYDANNPFLATLKVNRELLQSDARSCMHIEFDIDGSNMQYEAGDHIGLYPTNESELVEKLGTLCGADLDAHISLHDSKLCSNTFRTALTHHIEIATVPQIHMLKALTEYCTDETDKRFLELISSPSVGGRDLYQTWVLDAKRNIVHVLEDIKSCHPPIDFVCQMLPKMQPRYYSISSSSRLHPNIVHMTVVLVKYETKSGRINKGVATAFLANNNLETKSSDGTRIPVFIRKSQFHLPPNTQTPIIMIGTGTGLAPFRGFIQHRNQAREEGDLVGDTILYFGARKRSEDFIYEEELKTYVQNGALKMHTAFSRDQQEKKYVTHLIHDDADVIWQVIGNMGHIYICGDARHMANDVRNILLNIIKTKTNIDAASAEDYLKNMETQKRYSVDVWS